MISIDILPYEIKLSIVKYLDLKDLPKISLLNKNWYKLIRDENLWKFLVKKNIGNIDQIDGSWYMTYRLNNNNWVYLVTIRDCQCDSPDVFGIYKSVDIAIGSVYKELINPYYNLRNNPRYDPFFVNYFRNKIKSNKDYQKITDIEFETYIYNCNNGILDVSLSSKLDDYYLVVLTEYMLEYKLNELNSMMPHVEKYFHLAYTGFTFVKIEAQYDTSHNFKNIFEQLDINPSLKNKLYHRFS